MTPSEEHIAFYHELGLAIEQWSVVERSLYAVLASCVRESSHHDFAIGFFSIENFRSKLAFADAIIKDALDEDAPQHLGAWKKLAGRLEGVAPRRNRLAHGRLKVFTEAPEGRRYALLPWLLPKGNRRVAQPPAEAICVRNIIRARYEFFAISISLRNFAARVEGRKETYAKASEQPKKAPTIPDIAAQIHAILGHPPQSSRAKRRAKEAADAAASLLVPLPESQED